MIYAYTGKTGSGKTFQMVRDAYPQWLNGVDIYSNTKLFFEEISNSNKYEDILANPENFTFWEKVSEIISVVVLCKLFKKDYCPKARGNIVYFEDITELMEVKDGLILLDEGQNLLEARNWESLPDEFSNKLRQHRKHNLDLFVTTQNLGTIDKNLRRLVGHWKHSKDIFALLWKRNPSWLTVHAVETKDIDELWGSVEDLAVTTLKTNYFLIHPFKKRLYDTLFDIGFTAYKTTWIQQDKQTKLLIHPKKTSLEKGRTLLLLLKYYFTQSKLTAVKKTWNS